MILEVITAIDLIDLEAVAYQGPIQGTIATAAIIGGATALVSGAISAGVNNKKRKEAAAESAEREAEAQMMRANRQPILNQADDIRALAAQVINQINSFGKSAKLMTLETVKGFLIDSKKSKFKL